MGKHIKWKLGYEDYGSKTTTKRRAAIAVKNLLRKRFWPEDIKQRLIRFLEKHSQ